MQLNAQQPQPLASTGAHLRRVLADAPRKHERHERHEPAAIHLSRENMAATGGMAPELPIRTLSEFRQSSYTELLPTTIRVGQPAKLGQAAR